MQGLTWAARAHSIMVFIWHKSPKWVFSLAFISKTITPGFLHIHRFSPATISKIEIIVLFQTSFGAVNSAIAHPQGLMNL